MSHYTKLAVNYQEKYEPELLLAIEKTLDAKPEVHEEPVELYNYWGEQTSRKTDATERSERCHIVVRRGQGKLEGRATNDCGWRRNGQGGYDAFIDEAGIHAKEQGEISQLYSAAVAEKQMKSMGYTVQRKQLENGHVQLVASKYT